MFVMVVRGLVPWTPRIYVESVVLYMNVVLFWIWAMLRSWRIRRTCFSCCRLKIKHNIGIVFVKMGQFSDACSKFEDIMQEKPDYASGNVAIVVYVFP